MTDGHEIKQLLDALATARTNAKSELRKATDNYLAANHITRDGTTGKWVNVRQCKRDKGRFYFIRRAWKSSRDEPCLAKWIDDGWAVRHGYLTSVTETMATIEQWEPSS